MSKAKSLPVWVLAELIVAAKTREEKQAIAKKRAVKPPVPECFVKVKTKLKRRTAHGL